MHKITLVCSAHRENGRCNSDELLRILRLINPEVAFEEMRPQDIYAYYRSGSVEAYAISKYRESKPIQSVPVDRYDIPEAHLVEIKRDFDCVFDCVARESQEYQRLEEKNAESVESGGFDYLNSIACETVFARLSKIEEETITGMGDPFLIRSLKTWRDLIQMRELAMVSNIYEYCRNNVFDTGVFLVGADHKTAIIKTIEEYASRKADPVSWRFYLGDQIS